MKSEPETCFGDTLYRNIPDIFGNQGSMPEPVQNDAGRTAGEADDTERAYGDLSEVVSRLEHLAERFSVVQPEGIFHWDGPTPVEPTRSDGARAPLPDPQLVRSIIRQRQMRQRFFDGDLFADPAWDMLLDLTAAKAEWARVSITSLCIASGVPASTALRWINILTDAGLLERVEDILDRRRTFIQLTDRAANAMAGYFHKLGAKPATVM